MCAPTHDALEEVHPGEDHAEGEDLERGERDPSGDQQAHADEHRRCGDEGRDPQHPRTVPETDTMRDQQHRE
jgi:hypothetical protein